MKTFWKALGITALAALVPVRFKKDEETGAKSFQSLLWKLDVAPKGGDSMEIGLDLMDGVITAPLMNLIDAKKEAELFTDNPEEAVLFDDDALGATIVDALREESAGEESAAGEDFDPEV